MGRTRSFTGAAFAALARAAPAAAQSDAPAARPPNILAIWGDDVGQSNVGACTMGLVGHRTPDIDRIAKEGMIFTDYCGEQSGAELGMRKEEPTIAGLLEARGHATGQFRKNHLGDRDEHLPTVHGFDEFFGNLYHLNAAEEPEHEDYPKNPEFRKTLGPRGVIHSWAQPEGTQKIGDTGPLTRKRMETIDDETSDAAIAFIEAQHAAGKPVFVWWNGTRMHFRTHVKQELRGISGQDEYADGMVEHDTHVGKPFAALDRLGLANDTMVFYRTDDGPHDNSWPDAAATPLRGEKNANWVGGWRVPAAVRWPGWVQPGAVSSEIMHHTDWLPTFLSAAGDATVKERRLSGLTANGRNTHYDWVIDRAWMLVPAQACVARFLATFEDWPPRQKARSFGVDQAMEVPKSGGGARQPRRGGGRGGARDQSHPARAAGARRRAASRGGVGREGAAQAGGRDARGHDRRRVRGDRRALARAGEASHVRPPAHRVRLRADARAPRLAARAGLRDLHRLARRRRARAAVVRARPRRPARAGDRERHPDAVRAARRRTGDRAARGGRLHRRRGEQAGRDPRVRRPAPGPGLAQLRRRLRDAGADDDGTGPAPRAPAPPRRRRARVRLRPRIVGRPAGPRPGRGGRPRLDRHRHEARLEARLPGAAARRPGARGRGEETT